MTSCTHKHRTEEAEVRCRVGDRYASVYGSGKFGIVHECRSAYSFDGKRRYTRYLSVTLYQTLEEASEAYYAKLVYCNASTPCSGTCVGMWTEPLYLRQGVAQ
jgi:hypothetical protein